MAGSFYESIPIFGEFAEAVRPENARPLPDDWVVGFSDVVGSTDVVANGRYKAVNMVGAGVIAAVANALERRPFPFVFGGDGASFATSEADAPAAAAALAAMANFAHDEFELDLRVAMIPVREIRAVGPDVKVARYGATRQRQERPERSGFAPTGALGSAWRPRLASASNQARPPPANIA